MICSTVLQCIKATVLHIKLHPIGDHQIITLCGSFAFLQSSGMFFLHLFEYVSSSCKFVMHYKGCSSAHSLSIKSCLHMLTQGKLCKHVPTPLQPVGCAQLDSMQGSSPAAWRKQNTCAITRNMLNVSHRDNLHLRWL